MARFVVHSIPGSPCGRAVLATLIEKGADFRFARVEPRSLKSPSHLALHPFGRVPVLEHDGLRLYETQAILRYLDRVLESPSLTPEDARLAARMDEIMGVSDWYLFQGVNNVIGFHRIVAPKLLGRVPDESAIAAAMPRAHTVVAELSRLLGDKEFLVTEQLTLADFLVSAQMDMLAQTPEWLPLTAERLNLRGWLARINARESLRATTWECVEAMAEAA